MGTTSRKSNAPVMPLTSSFHRSSSPSGRFGSRSSAFAAEVSSPFASSTSSSFYSSPSSSHVYSRQSSPTRVNLHGFAPVTSSAVRFSLASRSGSPNRSMAMTSRDQVICDDEFTSANRYRRRRRSGEESFSGVDPTFITSTEAEIGFRA
ncbi:hypothetical protein L1887_00704 [Cichorium endivia]|nr:hypothetical protein L1887_00704 [Cichorium endivia]